MAVNERTSSMVIKARDEYSRVLADLERKQGKLAAAQRRAADVASARGAIQQQREKYRQIGDELARTSRILNDLRATSRQNSEDFSHFSLVASNLARQMRGIVGETGKYRDALDKVTAKQQSGFKAFSQRVEGMQREAAAAKAAAAAQERLANIEARRQRVRASQASRASGSVGGFAAWSQGVDQRAAEVAARRTAVLERQQARLNGTMESGFAAWSKGVDRAQRLAAAQERLNNRVRSGFGAWSQYVDAVHRNRDATERASAVAAKKAEIQDRLNNRVRSGFAAWSRSVSGVEGYSNAVSRNVTQLKVLEAQAKRTRAAIGPLDVELVGLSKTVARTASRNNPISSNAGKRGNAQDVEVWGLRPWQLTNLGYQVNDVVSGLAMGQAPVQILAQQAGQFVQIWPNVMVSIARSIPVIAGVTAVLTPFVLAASRMRKEAESLKVFQENLSLLADGGNYDAQVLAQIARRFEDLGVPIKEVRKGILELAKLGVDQGQFDVFGEMADRLAEITGNDFSDEIKRIATAFKGGAESVRDLDKELQFLTADQLANIRSLDAAGKRTEALAVAQEALKSRLEESRRETTPWQKSVKELSREWDEFIDGLKDSGLIELAAKGLDLLALSAKGASAVLDEINDVFEPSTLDDQYRALNRRRNEILNAMKEARAPGTNANKLGFGEETSSYYQGLKADLAIVDAQIGAIGEKMQANAKALRAAKTEQSVATKLAEEEAKVRQDALTAVQKYLRDIERDGMEGQMTDREKFISQTVAKAQEEINKGKKDEIKLQGELLELVEAQAGQAFDLVQTGKLTKEFNDQLEALRFQASIVSETAREQYILVELEKQKTEWAEKGLKIDEEKLRILREQAGVTFDAQNSAFTTGSYGSLVDRIIGVESAGDPNAKNDKSSASGLGQFIKTTWLEMFRRYFPDRAAGMTEEAILALRFNAAESRRMVELYARENAAVLQKAGVAVTDAALYLAHFLGPQGALSVLQAAPGTPVADLIGADKIAANRSILEGKTAGQVTSWAQSRIGVKDADVAISVQLAELDAQRLATQADYLEDYKKRVAEQQFELDLIKKSAREAAISKAIHDEEVKAKEKGLSLTKAQREEIARLTGEAFDRENAELKVNDLMAKRAEMMTALQQAQNAGDTAQVIAIGEEIVSIERDLQTAIDAAIKFYEALGGVGADLAIMKLRNLKGEIKAAANDLETQFLPKAREINEQIANTGADAFDQLAQAVARGENVFDAFVNAVLQGLGEIIIEIGKAIIKQAIFNAISGGSAASGSGGIGSFISGAITSLFHDGGIVGGAGSGTKMVNPAVFANATRYHGGGVVGQKLAANEVPIIALKDEEVLTSNDPRHIKNGGGSQPPISLKNVNVFDPAEVFALALETEPGQKTMLNFVSANPRKIKNALGI